MTELADTASWARRVLALVVDWFVCTLVVLVFLGPLGWSDNQYSGFFTTGIFILESTILTALMGGSFGKLVTRLRVVRDADRGGFIGLPRALARSVLICLVIPPLVFRPDGRGLHDMAVGSATIKVI